MGLLVLFGCVGAVDGPVGEDVETADAAQEAEARASLAAYQGALTRAGHGAITTELLPAGTFYYAEDDHQQYLHKNPGGYCGLGGTGVSCPAGTGAALP